MTNFEYYKLVHHNYVRLCLILFFTLFSFLLICSSSFAADSFQTRVNCPIETSALPFLDDCFYYHAENSLLTPDAIKQCSWALREKPFCGQTTSAVEVIENVPTALEQINAGIENNPKLATAAKKVFFHSTYCGLNGGTFEDPKGSLNKIPCARMGQLAQASGAKYSDLCSLQPDSKKEACVAISDSIDRVKECMLNMNNRVFCDELVSGFMSGKCKEEHSLCSRGIPGELAKDSCQFGNYDRERCTGAGGGKLVCTGNTEPNEEGTECVAKACVTGNAVAAIDPTGVGNAAATIASNECPEPPAPMPPIDPINPVPPDNPPNDPPNDDDTVTDSDVDNLADMANNLGNSMFGSGGSSGGGINANPELSDIDVKGDIDFGNFDGDSGIQRAGQVSGDSSYGSLPTAATLPPMVQGLPGGTKKAGSGANGARANGGFRGGAPGGGANAASSNRGGGKAPRRGGRGMPYADIRKNMGGHVYHGAQGTGPAAAAVVAEKNKKKKLNKPGLPGTKANRDYQAALNGALQRGLSRAEGKKKVLPSNDAYCDREENFGCLKDIYLKVKSQGLLNAKGR